MMLKPINNVGRFQEMAYKQINQPCGNGF